MKTALLPVAGLLALVLTGSATMSVTYDQGGKLGGAMTFKLPQKGGLAK